ARLIALFTFPSLADYEIYRQKAAEDAECQAAMGFFKQTKCFRRYDRSFLPPVFE
ncbi:MAG: NIPSNAP family protein, partial [Blastocatellia bacterium]|nr:NIPSNAP family protein [Blastocatellia bacterium]